MTIVRINYKYRIFSNKHTPQIKDNAVFENFSRA